MVATAGSLGSLIGEAISDLEVEAGAGDLDENSAIFSSSVTILGVGSLSERESRGSSFIRLRARGCALKTIILTMTSSL